LIKKRRWPVSSLIRMLVDTPDLNGRWMTGSLLQKS